jgi:acetyl-CoA acyltransferase 2
MKRSGVEPGEIDHCVMGNAQQTSGDAIYGARHVMLKAGVPIEVPALTVNRLCGSGMQSVVTAAQMIQLGEAKTVLAGGMESMSQAPHVIRGMRWGVGLGEGKLEDSLMVALLDSYCNLYMANTAELYAEQQGITREMQDEFALRSQKGADDAYKAGRLQEELTPVALRNRRGEPTGEMFTEDDHRRPETTMDSLRKLKPAFGKNGTVTAGNASGIVDGGAAMVVMSLDDAEKRNLKPLGRIVSVGHRRCRSQDHGLGTSPCHAHRAEESWTHARRYRRDRTERGFRGAVSRGRKRAWARSQQSQRKWRCHRAGTSAGRDWLAAAGYAVV